MEEKEKKKDEVNGPQKERNKDDIFEIEEVRIEEMAIDGICGVY